MENERAGATTPGRRGERLRRVFLAVGVLLLLPAAGIIVLAVGLLLGGGEPSSRALRLLVAGISAALLASAGIALNLDRGRLALILACLGGAAVIGSLALR